MLFQKLMKKFKLVKYKFSFIYFSITYKILLIFFLKRRRPIYAQQKVVTRRVQ